MKTPLMLKLLLTKIRKLHFETIEEASPGPKVSLNTLLSHSFDYKRKEKKLSVVMSIKIFGEEAPFKIEMEFEGTFLTDRQATKKEIEPFAKINCSAILFPYIRETVADITRRAGFPPLHLAPINFIEAVRQKKRFTKPD